MWSILAACAMMTAQASEPVVDADQFLRLMAGALSEIESVRFTFEGRKWFTGPAGLTDDPKRHEMSWQGAYAFRSDGSTLLDCYIHGLSAERPIVHETMAMLQGRLESVTLVPGVKNPPHVLFETGGPGSFRKPGSPESILYLWYFKSLKNLDDRGYEFQSWEDVGGHRCLKVRIGRFRSGGADAPKSPRPSALATETVYWIDLARGGHPLRVEHYSGKRLISRVDEIRLEQFPASGGKSLWLPVHGEVATFRWARDDFHDAPVLIETCDVIPGSARLNGRLADAVFTVKGGRGAFEDARLRRVRREFEAIEPKPSPRTDPDEARRKLDEEIAEADRRAKPLEASSAAREAAFWTPVKQLALAASGAIVLAAALVLRRRAG